MITASSVSLGIQAQCFFSPVEQLCQMRLQTIPASIFTINAEVALLKTQEVIMHLCQIVKHIAQTFVFIMIAYLVFIGAHRLCPSASLLIQLSGGRDLALQRGLSFSTNDADIV